MNFKPKKSNLTKSLYIILVLCVLGIMFLMFYSFFNNKNSLEGNDENLLLGDPDTLPSDENLLKNDIVEENELENFIPRIESPTEAVLNATEPVPIVPNPVIAPITTEKPVIQPETKVKIDEVQAPAATEKAVEVSAVPDIFIKPLTGIMAKAFNKDELEYSVAMNDYRTHLGIDIESEVGVNVKAVANGIISSVYDDPMMGKTIEIDHGEGLVSVYMNLQPDLPKNIAVGNEVQCGDVIGGVGESSLIEISDVPHLHFAMRKNEVAVDPFEYIPE